MSKKISVVTGCAGFVGSHLTEELIKQGHTVYGIDNLSSGRLENIRHIDKNKFFFINASVVGPTPDIKEADWFFHLAARADVVPSIEDPVSYHTTNVTGTVKMLELARKLNVKSFVYAASSSCYGDMPLIPTSEHSPINTKYPYALTKYLGEKCVDHWRQLYGLPAVSLRLFNVYGPRSRTSGAYGAVMGVFLSQLANKKPFTVVGDGEQKRDFTHVKDVVGAFILSAELEARGVMNIGCGRPRSVNFLTKLLDEERPIELLPDRPGEPRITCADSGLARNLLGWEAKISFEEGVAEMLKYAIIFKDAPLWDKNSIAEATKTWFQYLT